MTDSTDGWQSFLDRWSQEWADAQDPNTPAGGAREGDEKARRAGWLGFPPASEERIQALEERLGHRLPPSYRTFLTVSDGWRHAGASCGCSPVPITHATLAPPWACCSRAWLVEPVAVTERSSTA